ncbi:MAG: hypothetical protein IJ529_00070 [Alphaproteobacteria bacterium]|nr:hypothetical protein [Alphaproteobacteria bacterium]MBQ9235102.1 hypothetical protein [Alphaproteobacteria bacterium]
MRLFKHNNTDLKKTITALWDFLTSKTCAFLLAVSAIVIGWYQFYISRPILKYFSETVNIISSRNDNAYELKIRGKKYDDVYQTKIILQNKGAAALSGADVSKIGHNPIRVVVPEQARMLHYTLDKSLTTPDLTAKLQEYNNDIVITFDFLNPDYQIGIAILHQTPQVRFSIAGSALNVNQITREWNDRQVKYWSFAALSLLYLILIGVYIFNHWRKRHPSSSKRRQTD